MNEISLQFDEREMKAFILDLLNLQNGTTYHFQSLGSHLSINFKGDNKSLQLSIHNWLTQPDRKQNFGGNNL